MYRLLEDLARAKTEHLFSGVSTELRRLTKAETCWLHLLLFGLNPNEMARHLSRSNLRPELAKSIYKYVEIMTDKKISDWAQIRLYLEDRGYRIEPASTANNQSKLIKLTMLIEGNLLEPADLLDRIKQNIQAGSLRIKSYYYEEE